MESQITSGLTGSPEVAGASNDLRWRFGTRLAFRFIFVYFALYNSAVLLRYLPFIAKPLAWYLQQWSKAAIWTGSHVLRQSITVHGSGSGDTAYNYVVVLCYLALALAASVVWSAFNRRSASHPRLHQWLRLSLRIALGGALISYGAAKVIKSQFPDPSLGRLLQPYGDSSPMGLLWTMMGASTAYNAFTGAVEMLGGLLLFIPGLTTMGALLAMAGMGNVFMLNMSYDVPVKLYSFHLLAIAFLLALPDLRRLADFLVFHRSAQIPPDPPLFQRKWLNYGVLTGMLLLGAYATYGSLRDAYAGHKFYTGAAAKSPLDGIWMTDEFSLDGELRPLTFADNTRWYRVIFDPGAELSLQSVDGARQRYRIRMNSEKKVITLVGRDNPALTYDFTFEQPTPQALTLTGQLEGRKISVRLHHVDTPKFLLNTRGFHWIAEYPYNH
ncbi:MAG TPA: hypothetical protein VNW97_05990 [Candidatus Saccharimonadales bacterium]|jgi:uncharacterized membrane protein YphA (DoxX/SURF4 family)|nr:hypothetical protein [Candidatus Saccharimonadales bacterium]